MKKRVVPTLKYLLTVFLEGLMKITDNLGLWDEIWTWDCWQLHYTKTFENTLWPISWHYPKIRVEILSKIVINLNQWA
jgi:hypothetical protein